MIKDFIFLLIVAYCEPARCGFKTRWSDWRGRDRFNLDYFPTGSTTYKDKNKQVGKEPDVSFCFDRLKDIPDLAVEVVFSSGSTNDLQKYQKLGVKEVWFWINNCLEIYVLADGSYQQQDSFHLHKIESKLLTKYIAKALTDNPRLLKQGFLSEIGD